MKRSFVLPILASLLLVGCATSSGPHAGDVLPTWLGGMPSDVPPRRGTPAYDAWQAERAQEAARPKGKAAGQ
jgi:hypothetical protein